MGWKMKMFFWWLWIAKMTVWIFWNWSQILVGSSLLGSAVAMKLFPTYGLYPGDLKKLTFGLISGDLSSLNGEIVSAYGAYASVPYLSDLLKALNLDVRGFMLSLAALHLLASALIFLPEGKRTAQVAGAWAVITMIGAEYCTRISRFQPSWAKGHETANSIGMTVTHVYLLYHGTRLVFQPKGVSAAVLGSRGSLGLASQMKAWLWSLVPAPIQNIITAVLARAASFWQRIVSSAAAFKQRCLAWKASASAIVARLTNRLTACCKRSESRGRSAVKSVTSTQKRESTPVPACFKAASKTITEAAAEKFIKKA